MVKGSLAEPLNGPGSRALTRTATPGIFKRGSRYVVRVRAGGRQVQRSARTLAEARALRAQLLADPPSAVVNTRVSVRAYASSWLETWKSRATAST